jgi:hypothetical protein
LLKTHSQQFLLQSKIPIFDVTHSEDFDLFEENEGSDTWTFEENIYESEYDILEILLERK